MRAIGAERAHHQQRQRGEILRAEQRDDAEIAEREAEAEREDEADIAGDQRPFDRRGTAASRRGRASGSACRACGRWRRAAAPSVAMAKGRESSALAMTTTSGAARSGRDAEIAHEEEGAERQRDGGHGEIGVGGSAEDGAQRARERGRGAGRGDERARGRARGRPRRRRSRGWSQRRSRRPAAPGRRRGRATPSSKHREQRRGEAEECRATRTSHLQQRARPARRASAARPGDRGWSRSGRSAALARMIDGAERDLDQRQLAPPRRGRNRAARRSRSRPRASAPPGRRRAAARWGSW